MKSKKILRNQNHNELYTTPSLTGGCCIFYTDEHNVDEDVMTIISQGDSWNGTVSAGITFRFVVRTSSYSSVVVASSNMKNSQIVRIITMSTKA